MKKEITASRVIYGVQMNVTFNKRELLEHYRFYKRTNGDKHFISFIKLYFNQRFNTYKCKVEKDMFKQKAFVVIENLMQDFKYMDYIDIDNTISSIVREIKGIE